MSAQFPYPNKQPDDLGFINKYTIITQEECKRILRKEYPDTIDEEMKLCQHFSSRVIEIVGGVIFKPYDSK